MKLNDERLLVPLRDRKQFNHRKLVGTVAKALGLRAEWIAAAFDKYNEMALEALLRGEKIEIANFGYAYLRPFKMRGARTGYTVQLTFTPSVIMKNIVNDREEQNIQLSEKMRNAYRKKNGLDPEGLREGYVSTKVGKLKRKQDGPKL